MTKKWQIQKIQNTMPAAFFLVFHFCCILPCLCSVTEYWHFNVNSSQIFNDNLNPRFSWVSNGLKLKPNPRWQIFRPAVLQTWSRKPRQASHDSDSKSSSTLGHLGKNRSFEGNATLAAARHVRNLKGELELVRLDLVTFPDPLWTKWVWEPD